MTPTNQSLTPSDLETLIAADQAPASFAHTQPIRRLIDRGLLMVQGSLIVFTPEGREVAEAGDCPTMAQERDLPLPAKRPI